MLAAGYSQGANNHELWLSNGLAVAPTALIQHRNQGLGHGTYNPNGCKLASDGNLWYNTSVDFNSEADCFNASKLTASSGAIGQSSGRWNGDGKFYDAIDISDVGDIRMSSRRVPEKKIRETYKRKAIEAEICGFEGVPFQSSASSSVVSLHGQANATWTTIFATDTVFNSAFPEGVEGVLSGTKPDGATSEFPLEREFVASAIALRSTDNGETWASFTPIIGTGLNTVTLTNEPAANIVLVHYETQAHFTEDDVNSEVLDLGAVWGGCSNQINQGALIASTLINKIVTGSSLGQVIDAPLLRHTLVDNGITKLSTANGSPHMHEALLFTYNNNTSAVKALDYLASESGQGKFCLVYKEMVYDVTAENGNTFTEVIGSDTQSSLSVGDLYFVNIPTIQGFYRNVLSVTGARLDDTRWNKDTNGNIRWSNGDIAMEVWNGTGWGDNNQFEVVDNQSTLTDDNGNTVLYGTASLRTQFFISESST